MIRGYRAGNPFSLAEQRSGRFWNTHPHTLTTTPPPWWLASPPRGCNQPCWLVIWPSFATHLALSFLLYIHPMVHLPKGYKKKLITQNTKEQAIDLNHLTYSQAHHLCTAIFELHHPVQPIFNHSNQMYKPYCLLFWSLRGTGRAKPGNQYQFWP